MSSRQDTLVTQRNFFEEEMANWPPGSNLVAQTKIEGVDLVAVGYKYSRRKVLCFLFKRRVLGVRDGNPYIAKWKNSKNNTVLQFVPRPQAISSNFADCNKVDVDNQSRQSDLKLEKRWVRHNEDSSTLPRLCLESRLLIYGKLTVTT